MKAQQEIPITVRETFLLMVSRVTSERSGRKYLRNSLMAQREKSNILLTESGGVEMRNLFSLICSMQTLSTSKGNVCQP